MHQIKKPKVLFFFASWSGPCQAYKIILERSLESYSEYFQPLECYDADLIEEALLRRWRIDGVPTTILISRYERELGRLTGYNKQEFTINFLLKGVM